MPGVRPILFPQCSNVLAYLPDCLVPHLCAILSPLFSFDTTVAQKVKALKQDGQHAVHKTPTMLTAVMFVMPALPARHLPQDQSVVIVHRIHPLGQMLVFRQLNDSDGPGCNTCQVNNIAHCV